MISSSKNYILTSTIHILNEWKNVPKILTVASTFRFSLILTFIYSSFVTTVFITLYFLDFKNILIKDFSILDKVKLSGMNSLI